MEGFNTNNPNYDPWLAETVFWLELMYGADTLEQQARKVLDFYELNGYSSQFIQRILSLVKDKKQVARKIETLFFILENAPMPVGGEMGLPSEDIDFSLFRWEDYKGLTAYNPGQMQRMAYTDSDGFRRIEIAGIPEPLYMAALGSYYLRDENGSINPNGIVFRAYLSNGFSFYIVAGDMKSDADTNPDSHQYTYNLSYGVNKENADVIEFIIDQDSMDISLWGNNFKEHPAYLQGEIIRLEKLDLSVIDS